MIEATCSACGTQNRIAEADVPVGAKFIACASCKSRVVLPVKASGAPALPKLPPPVPAKGPPDVPLGPAGGGKGDIIDLSDLPAPKRQSPLAGEASSKPAPKSALSNAFDDLPAPKARNAPGPLELDDLSAPAEPPGISDLPAPKHVTRAASPRPAAPAPHESIDGISDLPAPRGRVSAQSTAPKTVPASSAPIMDLPAPRAGGARALTDLPAPVKKPSGGLTDLPMPKPGGPTDLLTPKPGGPADLPAPKGFFDDLPQPARGAKGGSEPATNDVAPKGFFDDLPQPARGGKGGPGGSSGPATKDVAPKGFFDDLPQKAQSKTGLPVPVGPEPSSAKGFFDDLPKPKAPATFGAGAIDLGQESIEPIDLAPDEPDELDLIEPSAPTTSAIDSATRGQFDDLDLSAPSTPQTRVGADEQERAEAGIKFAATTKKSTDKPPPTPSSLSFSKPADNVALELEEPRDRGGFESDAKVSNRLGPRAAKEAAASDPDTARKAKRTKKVLAGLAIGLSLLGAGGFYMYRRHAAAQERADSITEHLAVARKAFGADDPGHWQRAVTAAEAVIALDPSNADAYGIAAEASLAGALADGKGGAARISKGKKLVSDALAAGVIGPALERAQALSTLTTAPDKAAPKFAALLAKAPKDSLLALYLGWAHTATSNVPAALKAYEVAAAGAPSIKLLGADVDGARADFTAVLDADKDNIPAQVGLAATLPVTQAQQEESDLLAILARKDIATADPRAVVQAWVLAGDLARKSGRLDAARERYRKALAIDAKDLSGNTGLAEVELRDKKLDLAQELITKVLTQAPNHAGAQIVQCEISLQKNDLKDAEARITSLTGRTPPLAPFELARLHMVSGKLHDRRKEDELAVEEYLAAAKLAGDRDLEPTFAAIAKLTEMSKQAAAAGNAEKEAAFKARAEELLLALSKLAENDPQLALTLANAYVQSGAPDKAEPWLRRVIAARPTDPDALYQLGKVLRRTGKNDEAIQLLQKAIELAPTRSEIGMELARTYELSKRDPEAGPLYDKLLADPDASLELRGHAGAFFVRTGKLDKAGEQGSKLLEADAHNATGHYLKAEGLLAAGQIEDARKELELAVSQERDARNLDGLGRATESLSLQRKDLALQNAALLLYIEANKLDPTRFSTLLGMGRLYVARREMTKAVISLLDANKLKANDSEVAFLLGSAYQELGTAQYKKTAIEWLQKSMSLAPAAETAYRLGQLYMDSEINKERPAIDSFRRAVEIVEAEDKKTGTPAPVWYPEALYQLGNLSNSTGDEGSACRAWQKYMTTNPKPGARVNEVRRALATSLQGGC